MTEATIGCFYMYIGAISVYARVLAMGCLVGILGEARLSRVGIVTLAAGVATMPLADSLGTLALAVGRIPLGTGFEFLLPTYAAPRLVMVGEARRRGAGAQSGETTTCSAGWGEAR